MPSTHLSLHYHLVFSTKGRRALITSQRRPHLHAYLGGIVRSRSGVPVAVGGTADHVHLLVGLRATHCLADVLRTVSRSDLIEVSCYIADQEEHHRTVTFQEEYVALLIQHGVEYDERYLW